MMNIEVSFSSAATTRMLASDLFFPSNCKLRRVVDKGSIRHTLAAVQDIFDAKKIKGLEHTWGKPVRALCRAVGSIAIGLIAAPAGALYHSVLGAGHAVMCLKGGESQKHHWEKIKKHMAAFFTDLITTGLTALGVAALAGAAASFEPFTICIAVVVNFIPVTSAIKPSDLSLFLEYPHERSVFFKSIVLKNDFGIIGKNGQLLNGNPREDKEHLAINKGSFGQLYSEQGIKFLETLNELQKALPANFQIPEFYPPTTEGIKNFLDAQTLEPNFNKAGWIKKLAVIEAKIKKMGLLTLECLKLQRYVFFFGEPPKITQPLYPISREECAKFFSPIMAPPEKASWASTLQNAIEVLKENEATKLQTLTEVISARKMNSRQQRSVSSSVADVSPPRLEDSVKENDSLNDPLTIYQEYRQRVKEKHEPFSLLGFVKKEDVTENSLKKALRELQRKIHPDKLKQTLASERIFSIFEKEFNVVYECVTTASELLKKQLEKNKR